MIDSTNPRIMAENIRMLNDKISKLASSITSVTANPSGDPTVQLTKLQIGEIVYGFEEITPSESTKKSTSKK